MKNLKQGETVTSQFGDVWPNAILVVDKIRINYKAQVLDFIVEIYKDAQARTDGLESIGERYIVDKETFLSNFDPSQPVLQLAAQCENYSLTLDGEDGQPKYDKFE